MNEKTAHKKYNEILHKVIEPLVGKRITFMHTLIGVGKNIFGPKFRGVFPSDKIPQLNDLSKYAILNLDKSTESGSHWIAVAKIGDEILVYDSFGRDSKRIIPSIFKSGNGTVVDSDRDSEQKLLQTNCGARSLAYLLFLDKYGKKAALLI